MGVDTGKDWPQILTIIFACIPGLTSAVILTWTAIFIPVLINDGSYDISEDEANFIPIMHSLGCILPSLFFFKAPDVIGRKYTLLLLCIPQTIFWLLTAISKNIYILYLAKFIGGVADAIMYAALPIYLGEVTTPRIRGTWGNGQTFSFNAGFFMLCVIGNKVTIAQTSYIFITLPIISIIAFIYMPESPYYYIMKGYDDKARRSLQWLLQKPNIDDDFRQLKKDVDRQISETGTWKDLFCIKSNRRALISCIFVRFGQQFAGISVFETYFQFIFEKAGQTSLTPELTAVVFSGVLWLIMTGFSFTLDVFGRRKSFIFSALGCAVCLAVESGYFFLDEFGYYDLTCVQWIPIVGLLVYIFFYCFGLGILPSLMAGELFSASIKSKALSLANFLMGMMLLVCAYIFKFFSSYLGLYAPFAIFSIISFVNFLLSFYLVPETKGKTLEEIQQDLKRSRKK